VETDLGVNPIATFPQKSTQVEVEDIQKGLPLGLGLLCRI